MTKKLIASVLAGSLAIGSFSTSVTAAPVVPPAPGLHFGHGASFAPWLVFGYAGGIILAALVANARDNRQLTPAEAWSGGTLFWFSQPVTAAGKPVGLTNRYWGMGWVNTTRLSGIARAALPAAPR